MSSTPPTVDQQPAADPPAGQASDPASVDAAPTSPKLSLTDFLDLSSLQEVQDSFAALTRYTTTILDAQGQQVTVPTDVSHREQSDQWLNHLLAGDDTETEPLSQTHNLHALSGEGNAFAAPIVVEGQVLGSIALQQQEVDGQTPAPSRDRFQQALAKLGLADEQIQEVTEAAEQTYAPSRAASIEFLYLLANSIARVCYQEYHARQRLDELSALYQVSTLLSGHRNLQQILDTAAKSVAEVMKVKAVVIRLLKEDADNELVPRAIYNLSKQYMNKGIIRLNQSELFREAMAGKMVHIPDMASDARILYPDDAQREGLVSMLCAGMVFQGKPIGVLQLYTGESRSFTRFEVNLICAITNLLATAIENAQLDQTRLDNQRMVRQLQLAADVQRRMLPGSMPHVPPFEIAARYVPSLELGGDFYDFIDLDGHLGIGIGDVVGKGVAASLLMASVRASLRAYAQDLYDLDEVLARVNTALCRDTLDNEFATLWYGVLDPRTLRLTYCNAGHEAPLLIRDGEIHQLGIGGMIVGIDATQVYHKSLWDLKPGDMILLYTDGLVDAFNFEHERFGRSRIEDALREAADRPAAEAINHILWTMRKFTGLRRSVDDTTLVVIKVTDTPADPNPK